MTVEKDHRQPQCGGGLNGEDRHSFLTSCAGPHTQVAEAENVSTDAQSPRNNRIMMDADQKIPTEWEGDHKHNHQFALAGPESLVDGKEMYSIFFAILVIFLPGRHPIRKRMN